MAITVIRKTNASGISSITLLINEKNRNERVSGIVLPKCPGSLERKCDAPRSGKCPISVSGMANTWMKKKRTEEHQRTGSVGGLYQSWCFSITVPLQHQGFITAILGGNTYSIENYAERRQGTYSILGDNPEPSMHGQASTSSHYNTINQWNLQGN